MTSIAIRPGWNPVSIGLLVAGFILWWPLGLAALAYILWGDRIMAIIDDARGQYRASGMSGVLHRSTGNTAFDDYRRRELDRLEAERRRLEEEAAAFETFMRDLRKAKDKEEFDRFMAARPSH